MLNTPQVQVFAVVTLWGNLYFGSFLLLTDISKRLSKNKRKVHSLPKKEKNSMEEGEDAEPIYQISSGDEDCSKGMKSMEHLSMVSLCMFKYFVFILFKDRLTSGVW